MPKNTTKRKQYDWDAIEREYALGQKSLRTLSTEFGPTPAGISKHAKAHGWVQDKSDEVKRKTKAALLKEVVDVNQAVNAPTREDINRAVETNVRVIREHRKDVRNGRELVQLLSDQLRFAADNREKLQDDIYEDTKGDKKPDLKRRNAMMKSVALPSHAGVLRDLSTALKNLIPLERQAFNIDDRPNGPPIDEIELVFVNPRKKSTDEN